MTDPILSLIVFLVAFTIFMVAFSLWVAIKEKTSKKEAVVAAFHAVFMIVWGNLIFVAIIALLALILALVFGVLRFTLS